MQGALRSFRRVVVDTPDQLTSVVGQLEGLDAVGLDVEMGQRIERLPGGIRRGIQILGLIQIAGGDLSVVIDPLRIDDLSPLRPLLASTTLKVLLGGATDVGLLEGRDLAVRRVIDVAETAVSVYGHREEGMRALAERALGIHIDKTIRRENWLRRPIDPNMLAYAHRDAELTLLLYRWFRAQHSEAVADHIRTQLQPQAPASIAEWIRHYLSRRLDPQRLLKDEGLDAAKDAERLTEDVRTAMGKDLSPNQKRRVIRLAGELRLAGLYHDILPYASSPSSIFRAGAARTLGKLGNNAATPVLERLTLDPITDVRTAAGLALAELEPAPPADTAEAIHSSSLKPEVLAALSRLRSGPITETPTVVPSAPPTPGPDEAA